MKHGEVKESRNGRETTVLVLDRVARWEKLCNTGFVSEREGTRLVANALRTGPAILRARRWGSIVHSTWAANGLHCAR